MFEIIAESVSKVKLLINLIDSILGTEYSIIKLSDTTMSKGAYSVIWFNSNRLECIHLSFFHNNFYFYQESIFYILQCLDENIEKQIRDIIEESGIIEEFREQREEIYSEKVINKLCGNT